MLLFSLHVIAENNHESLEYETLYSYYKEGAHNYELFIRLAKLTPDPALKLAFLKQAEVLSYKEDLALDIQKQKEKLGHTQANEVQNSPFWHYVLISKYLPPHQQSYLLSIFAILLIIVSSSHFLKNRRNDKTTSPFLLYFLLILTLLLFLQKVFISSHGMNRLSIAENLSDLKTERGIALSKLLVYSAPSSAAQETMILTPGSEILVYNNSKTNEWIQIQNTDKRKGWVKAESNIFIIK